MLKQHIEVPGDVESFIINGVTPRIRCQRIINFLLVQLDNMGDYDHFCSLIKKLSVVSDLSDKLSSGKCMIISIVEIMIYNQCKFFCVFRSYSCH